MDTSTISQFYSDDHNRLDGLFGQYLELKEKDPNEAIKVLEEFKSGREQHMAWEEAILFSEYDIRIPSVDEESPTVDLTFVGRDHDGPTPRAVKLSNRTERS